MCIVSKSFESSHSPPFIDYKWTNKMDIYVEDDNIVDALSEECYEDIVEIFNKVDEQNYDSVFTEMVFKCFSEKIISLFDADKKEKLLSDDTIDLIKKLNEIVQE